MDPVHALFGYNDGYIRRGFTYLAGDAYDYNYFRNRWLESNEMNFY